MKFAIVVLAMAVCGTFAEPQLNLISTVLKVVQNILEPNGKLLFINL